MLCSTTAPFMWLLMKVDVLLDLFKSRILSTTFGVYMMSPGILDRISFSIEGSYKMSPAGHTSLYVFLPLRIWNQGSVPLSYITCDGTERVATRDFPVWDLTRATGGVPGVLPLGFGPTHLCKHHVWPLQRGPAKDLDIDMQTTVVLMCAESLMLGAPLETPTPLLVLNTLNTF